MQDGLLLVHGYSESRLTIAKIPFPSGRIYWGARFVYDFNWNGWLGGGNCNPEDFPEGSIVPSWLYGSSYPMPTHVSNTRDYIEYIASVIPVSGPEAYKLAPARMPGSIRMQGVFA